jgi:RNA polymerase subunit RPABC4/transcription elongation factor Spt4
MYTCRDCEQPINQATEVCPYCGADLTDIPFDIESLAGPPRKKSAKRIAILWAIVLLSLVAIAWFALPWRLAGSKPECEAHAGAAITELEQALRAYQSTEGGFPSSLEPLGSRAHDALQEAESGRYTLQYTPGNPESAGSIKTYSLTARAGNYGYLNFFTDETGVVRATRENRAATAADARIDPSTLKSQ